MAREKPSAARCYAKALTHHTGPASVLYPHSGGISASPTAHPPWGGRTELVPTELTMRASPDPSRRRGGQVLIPAIPSAEIALPFPLRYLTVPRSAEREAAVGQVAYGSG